jgi:hypothetical protein
MKKLISLLVLTAFFHSPATSEPYFGRIVTVAAGTAVRLVGLRTLASQLKIQMQTGGTGRGYVLWAAPDVTCSNGGAGTTLVAELSPATSTAPGGSITLPENQDPAGGVDVRNFCVDGSHTADTIVVSWNVR